MALTSAFLVLIMIVIWKTHILLVIAYVLIIGSAELFLPLAFALFLMTIMVVWNYVYRKKYHFELDHKLSREEAKGCENEEEPFERLLFERLKEFIREDYWHNVSEGEVHGEIGEDGGDLVGEIGDLDRAWRSAVVHMVGEHEVVAAKGVNIGKRVLIDYAYNLLKKNLRQSKGCLIFLRRGCLKLE
ncbi:potassium transporter [Striga asiatica]|uniref:Potassium transporter n=1 Tax=Striga asiatica TaxID=4170 RepID=A0A5A7Q3X5_STRAF|nr:potassium transporter [Striga asiatica]